MIRTLVLALVILLSLAGCSATVQSDLGDKPMTASPTSTPSPKQAKASASPAVSASAAP